jgi:adenylosuccinate lyase
MKVWDEGGDFRDLIAKDKDISQNLSREEIESAFDVKYYLRNVGKIFERVFR